MRPDAHAIRDIAERRRRLKSDATSIDDELREAVSDGSTVDRDRRHVVQRRARAARSARRPNDVLLLGDRARNQPLVVVLVGAEPGRLRTRFDRRDSPSRAVVPKVGHGTQDQFAELVGGDSLTGRRHNIAHGGPRALSWSEVGLARRVFRRGDGRALQGRVPRRRVDLGRVGEQPVGRCGHDGRVRFETFERRLRRVDRARERLRVALGVRATCAHHLYESGVELA